MSRSLRTILPTVGLLLASTAAAAQAPFIAYGLAPNAQGVQQLVRLNPHAPNSVTTLGPTGVSLTGIDFRPATNQLYGYDGDRLYTVNLTTGAATQVFDVGDVAGNVGLDFNPTVDRLRLVGANGANLRLNPLNGMTTVDSAYRFAMGDVNLGKVPAFTAVAYTNSDNDPTTGTTLYAIDPTLGALVLVSSPNGGAVSTVGSLGIGAFSAVTAFDIVTAGGVNTAFFSAILDGSTFSRMYTLNLATGAATLVGTIGGTAVSGLAIQPVPEPGTWALMLTGMAGLGLVARRRRRSVQRSS
jgi:Domain of unknown function (DUF4394)/PEP-CTERM motif